MIGIMVSPLIVATIIIAILTIFGSFILWKLPTSYYFPFITGGEVQGYIDRGLLIIGIIILTFNYED
jgi:hypothetical protein